MRRLVLRSLMLLLATVFIFSFSAYAASVEQVQICMPDLDVYLYADGDDLAGMTAEDVSADLDGVALAVSELSQSQQGIFYVYMLDVSASIPVGHFEAAKQAILDAHERLRPQDKLALIYFGSEVTLLLEGGESRQDVVETVSALRNADLETRLYDAMAQLLDLASATENMRRIAVVISDGVNAYESGMTRQALEEKLLRTGVSVSALCLDSVTGEQLETFHDFIRVSGGELYTFGPDDAGDVLDGLLDRLAGGWHLALIAPNNLADGLEKSLTVRLGELEPVALTVRPEQWTPDETAPELVSAVWDETDGAITVVFSEPVNGAGTADSFTLTDDSGQTIALGLPAQADSVTWILPVEGEMPEYGIVTLCGTGLTDVSMEKNPLKEFSAAVFSRPRPAVLPTPPPSAEPSADGGFHIEKSTIIIIVGALLAVIVGVVLIVALSSRSKEKKPKDAAEKSRRKARDTAKPDGAAATFMFVEEKDQKK